MLSPLTLLASFLANLIPAAPLYAMQADDDKVQLEGKTTWTAVSGETGNKEEILGRTAHFHSGYSISWWEDGDDPCKFQLVTRHMNLGGTDDPNAEWCSGSPGNNKAVARFAADEYITALQICRTDKNDPTKDKLKGLRVWGRIVNKRTAALGSETGPDEDKHSHCDVWENKVSCPAGQVASRIKVFYKNYWNNYTDSLTSYGYATGISLGCRKVVEKEAASPGTLVPNEAPIVIH
jgi:hypothetical protein